MPVTPAMMGEERWGGQADPWGLQDSQPSLSGKVPANGRLCLRERWRVPEFGRNKGTLGKEGVPIHQVSAGTKAFTNSNTA